MFRPLINSLHRNLSRSNVVTAFAVKLRNQCNAVIRYSLTPSNDVEENGERFLIDTVSPYCNLLFDIGANKGDYTQLFLNNNEEVTVFLFEPSSQAYQHLTRRYLQNKKVQIRNIALGENVCERIFYEEENMGETSSLVPGFSNTHSKERRVTVSTIDQIINNENLKQVDFIKCDCEGYDFHVIKGAETSLSQNKIRFFQFEYNQPWAFAGSTLSAALGFFNRYNYDVYIIKSDGLYPFNYTYYGEFYAYANFLAVLRTENNIVQKIIK